MIYDKKLKERLEALANEYFVTKDNLNEKELNDLEDRIVKSTFNYAKKFVENMNDPHNFEDLLQQARWGILQAIRSYDPAKGTFCTHVVWQVRDKLGRLPYPRLVHTPSYLNILIRKYVRFKNNWLKATGVPPADNIILEKLDWDSETLAKVKTTLYAKRVSPASSDGIGSNSNMSEKINLKVDVENAMKALTEKQKLIITLYYFNQKSINDIQGITRMSRKAVEDTISSCKEILTEKLSAYK